MADLYLHIGHSKTGTTWIQATAALNRQALAAGGIGYPGFGVQRSADSTAIELGNASMAALSLEQLAATLAAAAPERGARGLLLSSEELFVQLNALADPAGVAAVARAAGFATLRVLLFIRDPMEHAASLWQQYLKRGGGSAGIEPFFEHYAVPERVAGFLESYGAHEAFRVTVLNYSRRRSDVLAPLARWLEMPHQDWKTPPVDRLNRSLTMGELAFQTALNRHLGKAGAVLSDALCERLPGIRPADLRPPLALQEAVWARLAPAIARINARLEPAERYRADIHAGEAEGVPVLEGEQITVIADALGAEIGRLRRQLAALGRTLAG